MEKKDTVRKSYKYDRTAAMRADSKTAAWNISEISKTRVEDLCDVADGAMLVLGFASADCDFLAIGTKIGRYLPDGVHFLLISTEGELCRQDGEQDLYYQGEADATLVMQSFSRRMLKTVQLISLPLPDDDIRKNRVNMHVEQRVDLLKRDLQQQRLAFSVNAQDTLALAYIDGLSSCDNVAMQAVYESRKFPCLIAGGAAGAGRTKRHTYIYDGTQLLERTLLLCLLKMQPGYHFAAFHTNTIEKAVQTYTVLDANSTLQTVYKVLDQQGQCDDLIAVLCRFLGCQTLAELKQALQAYTFGTEINGKVYLRSLRHIEEAHNCLHFYCGFAMGEKIMLLKKKPLEERVHHAWQQFMREKPQPFAGILHDCSQHRRYEKEAAFGDLFANMAVSGFSCRGEVLGVPMNDALVGVFFFKSERAFHDPGLDDFPIEYADFKSYFVMRRLKHIQIINDMEAKVHAIMAQKGLQLRNFERDLEFMPADPDEAFSQALNNFDIENVFDYKGEKKMRQMLSSIKADVGDNSSGEVGKLVTYMQVMMDRLHGQQHILQRQMKEMEKSVRFYAKDELTGTYSRRCGYELLRQMLGKTSGVAEFMTMVFIDVDNLKTANDVWGHEEGDFYLRTVVEMVSLALDGPDMICRYGGDEFIVVMLNQEEAAVASLLKKANEQLHTMSAKRERGYKMSFSFGTMFYDYSEPMDIEQVISRMDAKMYGYKVDKTEKTYEEQEL